MSGAVVVGASIGGVRTAEGLRRNGFTDPITLIGEEDELPYDKPPLSKRLLTGDTADSARLLTAAAARELEIGLELGVAAVRLDVAAREVHLADGRRLGYDEVVLATGSRARPSPWQTPSGLWTLRTLADSQGLREDLSRSRSVAVVGGGFIGAEVASSCRALGLDVDLVDPLPLPSEPVVGRSFAARLLELHHRHGTRTHVGVGVEDVRGVAGDLTVALTDGTLLRADTVVVGIGAEPVLEWLADSGLVLDDGVVCDAYGRAGAPGIHAVGDVARWRHPSRPGSRRVEHWTNAVEQAACVAAAIADPAAAQPHLPSGYVWTDQYDWRIQLVGAPSHAIRDVTVSAQDAGTPSVFATLYTADGETVCGAGTVNSPRTGLLLRRAVAAGAALDDTLETVEQSLGGRRLATAP